MAKKENIASVLAFEKKLVPSDGYMYGTSWGNKSEATPLQLREKSVRGTISNRFNKKDSKAFLDDPMKLDAKVESPNLQRVDACALEPHQDTLKLHFTLKVLGGITQPSACNNAPFKQSYSVAAQSYIDNQGFTELATRYATNIANARFLWRNRVGAEKIEVQVNAKNKTLNQSWTFDATQFNLRNFDETNNAVAELATLIAGVLASEDEFLLLDINCFVQVGIAQEVYPSEELVLDKGKGEKSKILYDVNDIAAMHSQKIGNAIRTIDTWYPDFSNEEQSAGPIAVEPYGAVTNLGRAYRTPKDKQDFYTFFDTWARGEQLVNIDDEHYVMAVLVRGGVFGESDK
ncbi:MAG: type I-F CRISPR-associated protein Csy3 [SAR86 cluster bacterium]|uniref:Type I-F CRISPR-associated protein Csy3 n=1 Tax=SAR86 cluster bacterium TaxID=2030880 RepID=A0A2A5C6X9_9GAMM|nr:MAG: type I-F CRISPR-associated protein Csy3 [SAR86 cluster bacterium]